MALVGYSDSEGSDFEEKKPPALKLPAPKHSKPTFQKVIDRSNPGKIQVSLPDVKLDTQKDNDMINEPPAKRPRLGGEGGGIPNFNSFLPAPKRAAPPSRNGSQRGLGKGVNLKTGATPGFSRESMESTTHDGDTDEIAGVQDNNGFTNGSVAASNTEVNTVKSLIGGSTVDAVVKKPATMFRPLSVARKPTKKKAPKPAAASAPATIETKLEPEPISKVSLFSMEGNGESPKVLSNLGTGAQPYSYEIVKGPETEGEASSYLLGYEESSLESSIPYTNHHSNEPPGVQSLDSIASDLNLSTSARRQLLGRSKQNGLATNVVNFNTDQEYAANEALRQAGEVQMHNPVRALASGKHSLKQLVNAATNQRDALEEQFASGRRNKKEAGNKYGW